MTISPPDANTSFLDDEGRLTQSNRSWANAVSRLAIETGTGSPEGVVEALPEKLYMDNAGTAGAILYIKRDPDIAGDKTTGWILV